MWTVNINIEVNYCLLMRKNPCLFRLKITLVKTLGSQLKAESKKKKKNCNRQFVVKTLVPQPFLAYDPIFTSQISGDPRAFFWSRPSIKKHQFRYFYTLYMFNPHGAVTPNLKTNGIIHTKVMIHIFQYSIPWGRLFSALTLAAIKYGFTDTDTRATQLI